MTPELGHVERKAGQCPSQPHRVGTRVCVAGTGTGLGWYKIFVVGGMIEVFVACMSTPPSHPAPCHAARLLPRWEQAKGEYTIQA